MKKYFEYDAVRDRLDGIEMILSQVKNGCLEAKCDELFAIELEYNSLLDLLRENKKYYQLIRRLSWYSWYKGEEKTIH